MCIRDSYNSTVDLDSLGTTSAEVASRIEPRIELNLSTCLLYTSDAADERSSVDLGGRRIIKKKKNN